MRSKSNPIAYGDRAEKPKQWDTTSSKTSNLDECHLEDAHPKVADALDEHGIVPGDKLIYPSKMGAKVDSAAVQDRYNLDHHSCSGSFAASR